MSDPGDARSLESGVSLPRGSWSFGKAGPDSHAGPAQAQSPVERAPQAPVCALKGGGAVPSTWLILTVGNQEGRG